MTRIQQQPVEFKLDGQNTTLQGFLNMTVQQAAADDSYDEKGAAMYVIAVILVYGISMVLLIGSLAKKNMRDKSQDIEEGQVSQYLNDAPFLKERSQRDKYKQLKSNIVEIVNSKARQQSDATKSTAPTSLASSCADEHTADDITAPASEPMAPPKSVVNKTAGVSTERTRNIAHKSSSKQQNSSGNPGPQVAHAPHAVVPGVHPITSYQTPPPRRKSIVGYFSPQLRHPPPQASLAAATAVADGATTSLLCDATTRSWGSARVYRQPTSDRSRGADRIGTHRAIFDDPVQEWLFSPYKHSDGIRKQMQARRATAPSAGGASSIVHEHRGTAGGDAQQPHCTCAQLMFVNDSFEPTSPGLGVFRAPTSPAGSGRQKAPTSPAATSVHVRNTQLSPGMTVNRHKSTASSAIKLEHRPKNETSRSFARSFSRSLTQLSCN